MRILFVLFVVLPIVEMWLLIKVGGVIGAWPTIGLVMLTAVIGASLLRSQGLDTLMRAQQRLDSGQLPATEILEGFFLAIGGALLLTPGFVTDAIGFSCLIRPMRRAIISNILARGIIQVQSQQFSGYTEVRPDQGTTIDGDFRRED